MMVIIMVILAAFGILVFGCLNCFQQDKQQTTVITSQAPMNQSIYTPQSYPLQGYPPQSYPPPGYPPQSYPPEGYSPQNSSQEKLAQGSPPAPQVYSPPQNYPQSQEYPSSQTYLSQQTTPYPTESPPPYNQ